MKDYSSLIENGQIWKKKPSHDGEEDTYVKVINARYYSGTKSNLVLVSTISYLRGEALRYSGALSDVSLLDHYQIVTGKEATTIALTHMI